MSGREMSEIETFGASDVEFESAMSKVWGDEPTKTPEKPATPARETTASAASAQGGDVGGDDYDDDDEATIPSVTVDAQGNVVVQDGDGDDEDEDEDEDSAGRGSPAPDRIANLRKEYERKLNNANRKNEADIAALRQENARILGQLQGIAAASQRSQEPAQQVDPYEGLDPNDPVDRAIIASKQAEAAAARIDKWQKDEEAKQQQQQQQAAKAAHVNRVQTGVTQLVEHHAAALGISTEVAKHHAWNAGLLAMGGGSAAEVQAASRSIRTALKTFQGKAPAPVKPAAPVHPANQNNGVSYARTGPATSRKNVATMSKADFDRAVEQELESIYRR